MKKITSKSKNVYLKLCKKKLHLYETWKVDLKLCFNPRHLCNISCCFSVRNQLTVSSKLTNKIESYAKINFQKFFSTFQTEFETNSTKRYGGRKRVNDQI